jgi:hypothetical protein
MTIPTRMNQLEPRLRQALIEASDEARRRVALTVSRLAVSRAGISDPRLGAALEQLLRGAYGGSPERSAVRAMTEELDDAAWDIQDRVEVGAADKADYMKAFMTARAVNAVWCALDPDPLAAAVEATYEAAAAIADVESLVTAVQGSLK